MSDIGDMWKEVKRERQANGRRRAAQAEVDFDAAATLARQHGWALIKFGDQYNLGGPNGELFQLYPSNQRIYQPPGKKGRNGKFLRFDGDEWDLAGIVDAAVRLR
ncbi:MAG TPA: hypothetical protein VM487_20925 [Phycisphaerae bacterium]|nr:hypothetical protein [Phycisphaerae bacterium]